MRDFSCTNSDDMNYEALAKKARFQDGGRWESACPNWGHRLFAGGIVLSF